MRSHRRMGRMTVVSSGPSLSQLPQPTKIDTDGADEHAQRNGYCVVPLDSTIYININDPIGLPAFKPRPTKPIPRWMQPSWMDMLPNQHRPSKTVQPRPLSILDDHFSDVISSPAKKLGILHVETICPRTAPITAELHSTRDSRSKAQTQAHTAIQISNKEALDSKSFIREIPQYPPRSFTNTIESLDSSSSQTTLRQNSSVRNTTPSRESALEPISVVPYPIPPRSSSVHPQDFMRPTSPTRMSRELHNRLGPSNPQLVQRNPSPLSYGIAKARNDVHSTMPAQNNEYLKLHNPKNSKSKTIQANISTMTGTASIAVAGRGRLMQVGNWRRQKPATKVSSPDIQDRLSKGGPVSVIPPITTQDNEAGVRVIKTRGGLKRSSAHGDLWKFFENGRSKGE
jgi:hypothetical protein